MTSQIPRNDWTGNVAIADEDVAIRITNLKKNYGTVEAVRGIDLAIAHGEIFGLIGPDGAGKTSVFQILGGVMPATSGEAIMLGRPARQARSYVGYLTQVFSLYHDLSVAENLRYMGELRRLSRDEIDHRGRRYLEMFGMERFGDRLAGRLSGGMKQKLSLACALIIEPKILLLDEPTTGVDPVSRREFWDALAELSNQGITIVVATPYLDEAERCTRIALMHEGRIHQTGTPRELRQSLGLQRLVVRASKLSQALDLLQQTPGINDAQRFGDRLDVMVKDAMSGEKLTRDTLRNAGIAVQQISVEAPTLENTFVALLRADKKETLTASFPMTRGPEARQSQAVAIGGRNLSKRFGHFDAVKNVSLEVRYGEIYGLLGANGAGKTTTIKILCGLIEATAGETSLAGETGPLRSSSVRRRVGYMSQKFSLYDDLTIEENLDFFAGVYGVPQEQRTAKKRWVLSFSGLEGRGQLMTGSLPGGWKQRVAFGAAVMHEPSVLFLDEPTSGVDPLARRTFWKMINSLADSGMAILVTTHYLEEAEQCNRLGMLVAGELVAQGTPSSLKAAQKGHLLELITDKPQRANNVLKAELDRWRISLFGDRLHVIVDEDADTGIRNITNRLAAAGISVVKAHEELYLARGCLHRRRRTNASGRQNSEGVEQSMKRVWAQVKKELTQLSRDRFTLSLALILPILLLLLLSKATSLTVKDIPVAVQDLDNTPLSRQYIEALAGSLSFKISGLPPDQSPERALARNAARAALIIPPHFERNLRRGENIDIQWLIDGTDANTANVMRGKAAAITQSFNRSIQPELLRLPIQPQVRYWFNPGREDIKYFGPGVLAFGMALFPTLLAALALSREGELKTILQVYVSSITAFEYVLGKVIAYTIVAWAEWIGGMIVLLAGFGLSLTGDPTPLLVTTFFYLLCTTCFGTMLGAAIPNQAAAIQAAQLGGFLMSFLLSGYIFPIQNIPQPLRFLSNFIPMRYYLEVIRDAFLRGGGWPAVWPAPIALALLSGLFFFRAWAVMKDMQVKA